MENFQTHGYYIFNLTHPLGWFSPFMKMLQSLPEVDKGISIVPTGELTYPSIYYHPLIQYVVLKILCHIRTSVAKVCGPEKIIHYIPGALFYVDDTGEIFSSKRRRTVKPFFRRFKDTCDIPDAIASLVVYMNLNQSRTIEICVAERSHVETGGLANTFPSKMCSNHPPFIDNTGRRYINLILAPGDVLILDGRMIEYVKQCIPARGTDLHLVFGIAITNEPGPLFDSYNVSALEEQGIPKKMRLGRQAPKRKIRLPKNITSWVQKHVNPKILNVDGPSADLSSATEITFSSLRTARLKPWVIHPGFYAAVHGFYAQRTEGSRKRKREK